MGKRLLWDPGELLAQTFSKLWVVLVGIQCGPPKESEDQEFRMIFWPGKQKPPVGGSIFRLLLLLLRR